MTRSDVMKVFNCEDTIILGKNKFVSVDDFLNIAGFKDCEPTKEAMLKFDDGEKGYKKLIETGNFAA